MRRYLALVMLTLGAVPMASAEGMPESAWEVRPLLVGSKAPVPGGLVDERGEPFDLGAAMRARPTVLVFYRGHW